MKTYLHRAARWTSVFLRTAELALHASRHKVDEPGNAEDFARVADVWSRHMLKLFRVSVRVEGNFQATKPEILVGNHVSYLDIPAICAVVPATFVAKAEISRWPIVGTAARAGGVVLVRRGCQESRKEAAAAVVKAVTGGRRVVVFPSGTTSLCEEKPWRPGIFRVAADAGLPVRPFHIAWSPLRDVAYIDQDRFPSHIWNVMGLPRVQATLTFGKRMKVTDPEDLCQSLWSKARGQSAPA